MGNLPPRRVSTLAWSLSTPATSLPLSARHVAVTRPTYPVPMTATFMGSSQFAVGSSQWEVLSYGSGPAANSWRHAVTNGCNGLLATRVSSMQKDTRVASNPLHNYLEEVNPAAGNT